VPGRPGGISATLHILVLVLPLPAFLLDGSRSGGPEEVADGLRLTGFFLERNVYGHLEKGLPPARVRLADRLKP